MSRQFEIEVFWLGFYEQKIIAARVQGIKPYTIFIHVNGLTAFITVK